MSKQPPNAKAPMPDDYVETMRYYIPDIPLAAIRDAWRHNATPMEVMRAMNRAEDEPW